MGQVFKKLSDGAEDKQPERSVYVYFTMRILPAVLFNILMAKLYLGNDCAFVFLWLSAMRLP